MPYYRACWTCACCRSLTTPVFEFHSEPRYPLAEDIARLKVDSSKLGARGVVGVEFGDTGVEVDAGWTAGGGKGISEGRATAGSALIASTIAGVVTGPARSGKGVGRYAGAVSTFLGTVLGDGAGMSIGFDVAFGTRAVSAVLTGADADGGDGNIEIGLSDTMGKDAFGDANGGEMATLDVSTTAGEPAALVGILDACSFTKEPEGEGCEGGDNELSSLPLLLPPLSTRPDPIRFSLLVRPPRRPSYPSGLKFASLHTGLPNDPRLGAPPL